MADDILYPTHTCFDDAMEFLETIARQGCGKEELLRYTVVHALVKPEGEILSHAWLEKEGEAGFAAIYQGNPVFCWCDTEEYRAGLVVLRETRYTVWQAFLETRRTGSSGPWEEEYRQHLKKD